MLFLVIPWLRCVIFPSVDTITAAVAIAAAATVPTFLYLESSFLPVFVSLESARIDIIMTRMQIVEEQAISKVEINGSRI